HISSAGPAALPTIERGAPRDLTVFSRSDGNQYIPGLTTKKSGYCFSSHSPNPSPILSGSGRVLNMASVAIIIIASGSSAAASISDALVILVISPADTGSHHGPRPVRCCAIFP